MGLVASHPEVLWGTPCLTGTRVPAETLFDYLEAGETIEDFLRDFPSVTRERAVETLHASRAALVASELGPG